MRHEIGYPKLIEFGLDRVHTCMYGPSSAVYSENAMSLPFVEPL